ncbi:MAG: hypothetical protein DHS20C19_19860 [Acidimicrobiales bacterium]|nr:MAG: hypothetical protein DHS20C19_19860 [Acidimicrobiales bacterium]
MTVVTPVVEAAGVAVDRLVIVVVGIGGSVILAFALREQGAGPSVAVGMAVLFGVAMIGLMLASEKMDTRTHEQLHLAIHDPRSIPRVDDALAEMDDGEVVIASTTSRTPALLDRVGIRTKPDAEVVAWAEVTKVTAGVGRPGGRLTAFRTIVCTVGDSQLVLSMKAPGFVAVFAMLVDRTPHAEHEVRPLL